MKDLDIFVTVELFEYTAAVSYEWKEVQIPNLVAHGKILHCKCDNIVLVVVPGLSSETNICGSAADSAEDTKE